MNKEELYKEIDSVEQQVKKIYLEIMDENEISPYKRCLLEEKLRLLVMKLDAVLTSISFNDNMELITHRKKLRNTILLSAGALILSFINPIPIIIILVNICIFYRLSKLKNEFSYEKRTEKAKLIEEQLQSIYITVQNCNAFMNSKYKKREKRIIKESDENKNILNNIEFANAFLENILLGGSATDIPDDIKFYIIKMLQEDLNTKEESLDELINIARTKMTFENLNTELDLKIKLLKKN